MKVIKTSISDVDVFIQVADDNIIEVDNSVVNNDSSVDLLTVPFERNGSNMGIDSGNMGIGGGSMGIDIGSIGKAVKKTTTVVVDKALEDAATIIFAFADNCRKQAEIHNNTPDEMEIEYSLSASLNAEAWIFTTGANSNIKVRMKWGKN